MAGPRDSIGGFILLLAGPTIWAAHFFLMYGAQTLICTGSNVAARSELLLPVDVVLTIVATTCLLYVMTGWPLSRRHFHQATEGMSKLFWRDTSAALVVLAMLGILWVALLPVFLPACVSPTA